MTFLSQTSTLHESIEFMQSRSLTGGINATCQSNFYSTDSETRRPTTANNLDAKTIGLT